MTSQDGSTRHFVEFKVLLLDLYTRPFFGTSISFSVWNCSWSTLANSRSDLYSLGFLASCSNWC